MNRVYGVRPRRLGFGAGTGTTTETATRDADAFKRTLSLLFGPRVAGADSAAVCCPGRCLLTLDPSSGPRKVPSKGIGYMELEFFNPGLRGRLKTTMNSNDNRSPPLDHFPEGQHLLDRKGDRPSGK